MQHYVCTHRGGEKKHIDEKTEQKRHSLVKMMN